MSNLQHYISCIYRISQGDCQEQGRYDNMTGSKDENNEGDFSSAILWGLCFSPATSRSYSLATPSTNGGGFKCDAFFLLLCLSAWSASGVRPPWLATPSATPSRSCRRPRRPRSVWRPPGSWAAVTRPKRSKRWRRRSRTRSRACAKLPRRPSGRPARGPRQPRPRCERRWTTRSRG